MLARRFALCALIGFVAVAAWSTTTSRWDSAPGTALVVRTPIECAPRPACDQALAKTKFQQGVKADPTDKYGWYNLGVIAQGDNDSKTATLDYDKAIAIDPKFETPLYNLGTMRLQAGDYTAAVGLLNRAVADNPRDANTLAKLALALNHLHTAAGTEQAKVALSKALKLDPALLRTVTTETTNK